MRIPIATLCTSYVVHMSAKDIFVVPISAHDARAFIKRHHYSGKVVNNSQLHIGVFWNSKLEGVMQFGPPMDRRKLLGLVRGTKWNSMMELNRMAFTEILPRNSESRALGVAMRMFRKFRPDIEWIVSFADGTQCGDGTIYRAAGFVLTGIQKNNQIWVSPKGETAIRFALQKDKNVRMSGGSTSMKKYKESGWEPMEGYQLRYVYFLNPASRERLTVPIIPFSKIDEIGARMYKGERVSVGSVDSDTSGYQPEEGGASPTPTLQNTGVMND